MDWRAPVNFPIEPDEWKALTPDEFERVKASTTLDLTPDEWDRLREVREGRLMRPGSFKSICYVKSPVPTDGVEEAAEAELKFRRRCEVCKKQFSCAFTLADHMAQHYTNMD